MHNVAVRLTRSGICASVGFLAGGVVSSCVMSRSHSRRLICGSSDVAQTRMNASQPGMQLDPWLRASAS